MNKNYDFYDAGSGEQKEVSGKQVLSKFDYELFDEENNVVNMLLRVKKVNLPNKGENWKIMKDNTVLFIVEGIKLTNKEKNFLRTAEGLNCLLQGAKQGIKTMSGVKAEIKKILKQK